MGVLAETAYAREDLPALPAPPLPPARPGPAAVLPVDPPADAGVTAEELATLAAGAAVRAWALAHGEPFGVDRDRRPEPSFTLQ